MRLAFYLTFLLWIGVQSASSAVIDAVKAHAGAYEMVQVSIEGADIKASDVKVFEIPGESPRIVIDIAQATSPLFVKGVYKADGLADVKAIRGAHRNNGLRFVVDIAGTASFKTKTVSGSQILLNIQSKGSVKANSSVITAVEMNWDGQIPIPRLKPKPATYQKPVIVIDAGHGGYDPGAIGSTGLQEKSVTLKAAIELKQQLLATGRYKVVMSRDTDRYVDHDNRLRVARVKGADLFISVHADATAGKTARGASVYTLADRAKSRSKGIVNTQNWIMDVNLSEQSDSVGNILVDLAQRTTLSQSTQFADILIGKLGVSTELLRNTHRRAGYYVLLAPDVPAVLLEMGFISNPTDERLLKSSAHRQKIMKSVTSAINTYFARQKS